MGSKEGSFVEEGQGAHGEKDSISLSLVLAWTPVRAEAALKSSSQGSQETRISTGQFKLLTQPRSFILQFVFNSKTKQVAIPRDWLVPPEDEKYEESGNTYVSSFSCDRQVDSFPIGNGRIGLQRQEAGGQ